MQKAVQLGRISHEQAAKHCSTLALLPPSQTGNAIAGLITGKAIRPKDEHRAKFQALRDSVKRRADELASMTAEEKAAAREKELSDHRKLIKGIGDE